MELRIKVTEPDFPGFLKFVAQFSTLDRLPAGWVQTLRSSGGVYLLTCPASGGQYVGSATGECGFWQRWQDCARSGHGGNVALESRNPSDYQVSVLQVAGTDATTVEIIAMEELWKKKLQSKEMGLNR
ncbi:MAG: hypothetical protein ACLQU1_22705 [Bryobacteraceae bacterium]